MQSLKEIHAWAQMQVPLSKATIGLAVLLLTKHVLKSNFLLKRPNFFYFIY